MTPSHTGLGAVVLCTAGGQRVAVDMRYVTGTDRGDPSAVGTVDLGARLGIDVPAGRATRILHLATAAGRLALGCEHVSQPLDTPERIPLPALIGPAAQGVFESLANVGDAWHLVLDVGALFGLARRDEPAPPQPVTDAVARSPRRRHASRGHLVVFSTGSPDGTEDTGPGALAYALGAAACATGAGVRWSWWTWPPGSCRHRPGRTRPHGSSSAAGEAASGWASSPRPMSRWCVCPCAMRRARLRCPWIPRARA
jgi:hypothetical protein